MTLSYDEGIHWLCSLEPRFDTANGALILSRISGYADPSHSMCLLSTIYLFDFTKSPLGLRRPVKELGVAESKVSLAISVDGDHLLVECFDSINSCHSGTSSTSLTLSYYPCWRTEYNSQRGRRAFCFSYAYPLCLPHAPAPCGQSLPRQPYTDGSNHGELRRIVKIST